MPETTENYHRVPNTKHTESECENIRTMTVSGEKGIKALYCIDHKKIKTYLFDVEKWSMDEAKRWVVNHSKEVHLMDNFIAKAYVEKSDNDEEGILEAAVASTGNEDRHGEELNQEGWELKNFKKNPAFLWGHNFREERPPIGKVLKVWLDGEGKKTRLMFKPKFDLEDPFAAEIYRKYKDGFLNSFSVGYIPLEIDGNQHLKMELLEISAVAVPANADANVRRGLEEFKIKTITWEGIYKCLYGCNLESKDIIPFSGFPIAEESRAWNGGTAEGRIRNWAGGPELEKIDWLKYRKGFTWFDSRDEKNLRSYKLLHHDIENEELVTVWTGIRTAMAILLGARGGIDIPESDRKGIYNHLLRHYEQFEKEVPEFKYVEDQVLKKLEGEIKGDAYEKAVSDVKGQITDLRNEVKSIFSKKENEQEKKNIFEMQKLRKALKIISIALTKGGEKKDGQR